MSKFLFTDDRTAIRQRYRRSETELIAELQQHCETHSPLYPGITQHALQLTQQLKHSRAEKRLSACLTREFSLASPGGLALMQLAEALLRTPDAKTRQAL